MPSKSEMVFKSWTMLSRARDVTLRARNKELASLSISAREAATLYAIHHIGEKTTPAEIARFLYRKPHTIASILNRMLKRGLINRSKDLEYKNLVRVSLTEKGQQLCGDSIKRESIYRIFGSLSKDELAQLVSLLAKITDNAVKETGESIQWPFP